MNLLYFTHAAPQFLPPVIIDEQEIVAGPNYTNLKQQSRWKYMNTPSGGFDIDLLLKKMPNQRPDYIFVHVDATMGCLPQNLPESATKVLLVGDTHHLNQPIQNLIRYAASVSFDAIIVWNRQHAHFFTEFGFENVYWIPGLSFAIPEIPSVKEKLNQLCFFGQMGAYHPRRNRYIQGLQAEKIPMVGGRLPRMDSLRLAAQSALSLNVTLNSEWNLRIFESAQNQSMLLTDRLSDKTGLEIFYQNGDALVTYESLEELVEHVRYFAANQELVSTISGKAAAITREYFSFEARRKAIFALINNDVTFDVYRLAGEPRCFLPAIDPNDQASFVIRLQIYEWAQEQHRLKEHFSIHHSRGVSPMIVSDLADLIRLRQYLYLELELFESNWRPALDELEVLNLTRIDQRSAQEEVPSLFITTTADLDMVDVQMIIREKKAQAVLISDFHVTKDVRFERAMVEFGYKTQHESILGMFTAE